MQSWLPQVDLMRTGAILFAVGIAMAVIEHLVAAGLGGATAGVVMMAIAYYRKRNPKA